MKKILREIAIVALIFLMTFSAVYAAVLLYYGQITSTITVDQSVLLDGTACPASEITESISAVGGQLVYGPTHWLTNRNPDIDAIVSLDSTFTTDGLQTVIPEFRLDAILNEDNDDFLVIVPTTTWAGFQSVSFECFVTEESVYTNTPHVNIALRDPSTGEFKCIVVFSEKLATKGIWQTVTFIKADSYWSSDSPNGTWVFNCFTIEVADGSGKITAEQVQTVWVRNPTLNDVLMYWFRIPNANCENVPARTVVFRIGYKFRMEAIDGYTVITKVTPRGEYTQGGAYTS